MKQMPTEKLRDRRVWLLFPSILHILFPLQTKVWVHSCLGLGDQKLWGETLKHRLKHMEHKVERRGNCLLGSHSLVLKTGSALTEECKCWHRSIKKKASLYTAWSIKETIWIQHHVLKLMEGREREQQPAERKTQQKWWIYEKEYEHYRNNKERGKP